ncbi:uncharacterized protein LOC21403639 [Morus notabilis]|uniref:uncharacterized protein LOC21403639 n=1 Tax=Morus notabilis TaxID=981085 RepID=UPI000CED4404|nr:uncharacterized protein LOC21403639 [Morus notabilis]
MDARIRQPAEVLGIHRIIDLWVQGHVLSTAAKSAGVPVILDAGGVDAPISQELMGNIMVLLLLYIRLYGHGVKQVLVKLGARGSALFVEGEEPIKQPVIAAEKVLDTTGAGDTFTASFAVALVEGKSKKECLKFAAAAASLCVQVKGAIPSMPDRKSVMNLLQSLYKSSQDLPNSVPIHEGQVRNGCAIVLD